jgi:hypothetical protein
MKNITKLASVLAASFITCSAAAQAPKYVLLEEFTGMNCGPCAAQNPGFLTNILTPNPIVVHHIAYHPSWPGVDNMYTYNKGPVDSMVTEYAVTGVPNVEMLGNQKNTGPAGILQSDVDNEFSAGSPIKVVVTDVIVSGNNHTATINVSTVGAVPSGTYRLRTVVTEYLHFATAPGTNGEKDFPNVFRKMMPSWKGDLITLPTIGNTVTFTYNYVADPLWNQANVKLTAYVQNVTSKEVLNCGSTGDPSINYTLGTPSVTVQHGTASAQNSFNFSSLNTGSAAEQFSYSLTTNAPAGWSANFTVGGTPYTTTATITTAAAATNNIVINVTPDATPFVATYTMKVQSVTNPTNPAMISSVYVISNVSDLIVNNSGNVGDGVTLGSAANWDSVYTTGLAYANRMTVGKTDEKVMTMAISQGAFAGVRNVYLNIGWTFPSFTDVEVAQLTPFLNGGGCLLVSGQDVGWDTWGASPAQGTANTKAFFTNYLNASWIADGDATNLTLKTVATDAVWGVMTNAPIAHFYGSTNFYPDQIKPVGIGTAIYTYDDTTRIAGVRSYNGLWKTVYIGTGVEMVASPLDRRTIVKRAHDWFYGLTPTGQTGINEKGAPAHMLGQNYPNPSNSATTIPMTNIDKDMTLEVVDLYGRVISAQQVSRGTESVIISTSGLAQGIYMCRLMDGQSLVACRPMEVTK